MRLGSLVVVVLAGCGRLGFDVASGTTSPDAAAVVPDAAPDAQMLLEMLVVPSDGSTVASATTLDEGVHYTLVASGTFTAVPPAVDPLADAEYYDMTDPDKGPIDVDANNQVDFGLAIDAPGLGLDKTPHWGAYRDDHTYTVDFVGKGAPIQATIFDCCPQDNAGSLTVQILR